MAFVGLRIRLLVAVGFFFVGVLERQLIVVGILIAVLLGDSRSEGRGMRP
ncbi:hypothetical protein ACWD0A_33875 [Streptomyces sp. NPDC002867]